MFVTLRAARMLDCKKHAIKMLKSVFPHIHASNAYLQSIKALQPDLLFLFPDDDVGPAIVIECETHCCDKDGVAALRLCKCTRAVVGLL